MKKSTFTPEELAELEAFDAMIDEEPDWDPEEIKAARERDNAARDEGRDRRKAAIAEYQRGYRAANKEAIAEYQRGYRAAGSDIRAEQSPLRQWRRDRHYSQTTAARLLKVSQSKISNIERGIQPMPEAIQEAISR